MSVVFHSDVDVMTKGDRRETVLRSCDRNAYPCRGPLLLYIVDYKHYLHGWRGLQRPSLAGITKPHFHGWLELSATVFSRFVYVFIWIIVSATGFVAQLAGNCVRKMQEDPGR